MHDVPKSVIRKAVRGPPVVVSPTGNIQGEPIDEGPKASKSSYDTAFLFASFYFFSPHCCREQKGVFSVADR